MLSAVSDSRDVTSKRYFARDLRYSASAANSGLYCDTGSSKFLLCGGYADSREDAGPARVRPFERARIMCLHIFAAASLPKEYRIKRFPGKSTVRVTMETIVDPRVSLLNPAPRLHPRTNSTTLESAAERVRSTSLVKLSDTRVR